MRPFRYVESAGTHTPARSVGATAVATDPFNVAKSTGPGTLSAIFVYAAGIDETAHVGEADPYTL